MKYTLLELTQAILGSMESDEVSDIGETPESRDVVRIIKECYYDIAGQHNLQEHQGVFKLDSSTDNLKPALMLIPSKVIKIDWLKYNIGTLANPDYRNLQFIPIDEFFFYQSQMNADEGEIDSMSVNIQGDGHVLKFYNDRFPHYYTIFDEYQVVFDGFDSSVETTLTTVRSQGYGLLSPVFVEENTFIPDLDHRQFQLLLQDAKSTAHVELKQAANPKAEAKYRRNMILAQKTRVDNNPAASNQERIVFGRRPR